MLVTAASPTTEEESDDGHVTSATENKNCELGILQQIESSSIYTGTLLLQFRVTIQIQTAT